MSLAPTVLSSAAGTSAYSPLFYSSKVVYVGSFFLGGVILFLVADRLWISWPGWILFLLIFAMALFSPFLISRIMLPFIAPYLAIAGSCLIPFSRFDDLGDFSYGIYIYHYPIQQAIFGATLQDNVPLGAFFLFSWIASLLMAYLSWHFVEKPAMNCCNHFNH